MTTTPSKLQASLASKTKSPIKYSIREDSPSRAITKSKATDTKLQEMSTRRQNLIQCFDIYQLLFQNNAPQRCIAHNNFLTLYCQNQHKLLCVNCIYGDSSHKNHRVIPIKNAFSKIEQDNALMKKHLRQYIEQIKLFQRNALQAKQQAESTLKSFLHQLQDQYNLTVNALQDRYHRMRQSIIYSFKGDTSHTQLLAKEVDWLKQTYIQRERGLPTSEEQSSLIYTHNILTLMLENDNLRQQKVQVADVSEMKGSTISQLRRIAEVIGGGNSQPAKKRIF